MSAIAHLRDVSLFAGLTGEELAALAPSLVQRNVAAGVLIFHRGSPGRTLYVIQAGRVRIFLPSEAGAEITVNLYGPGEVFGELALLDERPRSASAIAVEQTVLLALNRADLEERLAACPRLARNIITLLVTRLRYTTVYAESLAFLDANGRVAARLLELADRFGVVTPSGLEFDLHLTQGELASWVGASREKVNKVLAHYHAAGLIAVNGQRFTVLDRPALERQIAF